MFSNAGFHEYEGKNKAPRPEGSGYTALRIGSLIRPESKDGGPWHWAINPYEGCEFGCTFCSARLDKKSFSDWRAFESRVLMKSNAAEVLQRELKENDPRERQLVLGSATDPWQPVEEGARITRAVLSVLAGFEGLDLHINTRSSMIARDTDLLREIAKRSRVSVALSIASIDDKINRLLEPKAPTVFRRLAAMEALSRAGVNVGLMVSPVMSGLDEDELGLEPLLTRAANAGGRFAGLAFMQFAHGQRELFLQRVTEAYPTLATRFRRVLGRRPPGEDEKLELIRTFDRLCTSLGLEPHAQATAPRATPRAAPSQLALW